jgi:hypothetical protein
MQFLIDVDTKEVEELLKTFPMRAKKALADGLDHATRSFLAKFYAERLRGRPGITARRGGIFHRFRRVVMVKGKKVFLRQQGKVSESVRAIAQSATEPMDMSVEMYTESKVAGIHERGGLISGGRSMPIPLNEEARDLIRNRVGITSLDMIPINGRVYLGRKQPGERPELLFILKKGVRIPPRLGFYRTWGAHSSRRQQIMDQSLESALDKAV